MYKTIYLINIFLKHFVYWDEIIENRECDIVQFFIWEIILDIRISDILTENDTIYIMIYLEIIACILIRQFHKWYVEYCDFTWRNIVCKCEWLFYLFIHFLGWVFHCFNYVKSMCQQYFVICLYKFKECTKITLYGTVKVQNVQEKKNKLLNYYVNDVFVIYIRDNGSQHASYQHFLIKRDFNQNIYNLFFD